MVCFRREILASSILSTVAAFVGLDSAAIAVPLNNAPPILKKQDNDPGRTESRESWDAVFIAGRKAGSIHVNVEPLTASNGRALQRVVIEWRLAFERLGDKVEIERRFGTIETPEGQILRLDSRTSVGPTEIKLFGDARGNRLPLTLEAGGQRQELVLDWGADVRGPFGPELSMGRSPLMPGETRKIKTFVPDLNVVGTTTLKATELVDVQLGGDATMRLLRVESEVLGTDGKPLPGMDTTYFVDASGQILKSETDSFGGLITYRTTRSGALEPARGGFPIVESLIVPSTRPINNPETVRSAVYRLRFKDANLDEILPTDSRQTLEKQTNGTWELSVKTTGVQDGRPGPATVASEFSEANPVIDRGDERVVALMRRAIANTPNDPWSRATAITNWVAQNLREKDFETTFATASDVARSLSGDCSEHAVLTAAMCRAAGIPTRVVTGLIYAELLNGFGFHMWNEVYVNGRWVAVDAAVGQTEVDATHLKLDSTSLNGISPFAAFLDVVRVEGKLRIEPIRVQ